MDERRDNILVSYVWAAIILVAIGGCFILGILYMRPNADPLVVIGAVTAAATTTGAAVMSLLQSQQTHLSVNGRLTQFMAVHAQNARAEGVAQGVINEQTRTAAVLALANATSPLTPRIDPSIIKATDVQIDASGDVNIGQKEKK